VVKFQVLSHPSGAFVSVNGKGVGRAPLELEYEAGTKLSLFSKVRGHLARRRKVTVGTEQEAVNLWLAPLPYVVQVVTNPAGARASSVGGGEATTPGALQFKSMPGSRKIVVSKDGYKTASKSLTRADFTEETRRMAATVTLTLQKDGAAEPAPAATEAEPPVEPPPSELKAEAEPPAEPPPSEGKAEPTAPPKAVEEIPAPSETTAADAP
jgi:PEGA domain